MAAALDRKEALGSLAGPDRRDEAELDQMQGAGAGGHWDHGGGSSMWVTTVPGDAHGFFGPSENRSAVRPDGNGGYVRWDRANNCGAPASRRI